MLQRTIKGTDCPYKHNIYSISAEVLLQDSDKSAGQHILLRHTETSPLSYYNEIWTKTSDNIVLH